jgi:hypothetical protein
MRAIHRRQRAPPTGAAASPVRFERGPASGAGDSAERIHDARRPHHAAGQSEQQIHRAVVQHLRQRGVASGLDPSIWTLEACCLLKGTAR